MKIFWILWIFNAIMSLVPIYYFFVGLADGSITSRNITLWMVILLIVAGVLAGSMMLKNSDHLPLAKGILIVAAIPGIIAVIFMLAVLIGKPRWN